MKSNTSKFIVIYVLTFLLGPAAFKIAISLVEERFGLSLSALAKSTCTNVGIYLLLTICGILLFSKSLGEEVKKLEVSGAVMGAAAGLGMLVAEVFVNNHLSDYFNHAGTTSNQEKLNGLFAFSPVAIVISSVLLAPFVEELLYRLIIIGGLRKKLGKPGCLLGLLVSTLLFAAAHVPRFDLYSFAVYGFLGLCLGLVYLKDNSFFENYIMHAFHNALVLGAIYTTKLNIF